MATRKSPRCCWTPAPTVQAVTTDGFSALTFAARAGDVEIARLLIARGLPVNETGTDRVHALPYAALSGQDAFALFLLEQGADPNATLSGVTALHAASGDAGPVRRRLAARPERRRRTRRRVQRVYAAAVVAAALAAAPAALPLIRALLDKGARVNEPVTTSAMAQSYIGRPTKGAFESFSCGTGDFRGATPLWLAAFAANGGGGTLDFSGGDNSRSDGRRRTAAARDTRDCSDRGARSTPGPT